MGPNMVPKNKKQGCLTPIWDPKYLILEKVLKK